MELDNYSININKLVQNNEHIFNLKIYDNDDSLKKINTTLIDSYILENQTCSKDFLEFTKYIYDNTKYINSDYIIDRLLQNINDLYKKYNSYIHILIIPTKKDKSNFFFTLYFCKEYNKKFKKQILCISEQNKFQIFTKMKHQEKKILFILCDDFVYSGKQIKSGLLKFLLQNEFKNFKIYLNIFGITDNGYSYLHKSFMNDGEDVRYDPIKKKNVFFPKDIIIDTNSVKNIINKFIKYKKINFYEFYVKYNIFFLKEENNKYYLETALDELMRRINTFLIYIFYKFPDYVSTYTKLCTLEIFDDKTIIFNKNFVDKIIKEKEDFLEQMSKSIKIKNKDTIKNYHKKETYEKINIHLKNIFKMYIDNINDNHKNISSYEYLEKCSNTSKLAGLYNVIKNQIEFIQEKIGFNCNRHYVPFYKTLKYDDKDNILQ